MTKTTFVAESVNRWMLSSMDILTSFSAFQRSVNLADKTIKNRVSILRSLEARVGEPLTTLELRHLRAYLGRDNIAAGTRVTERAAMRAFYQWLQHDGYREDDPTEKLAPIKAPRTKPRPFSRPQVEAMLTSGAYRNTRVMILLGYYQGFRVSSIAAVHGDDLDLIGNTITSVVKGNKTLTFPLHPVIRRIASTMPEHDYWFPARGGRSGHILPTSVTDQITDAKRRAGITDPRLTPHSLRHSFGTDLVESGVDIRIIQELMGHESLTSTQIYTDVTVDQQREAIETLHLVKPPPQSGRARRPLSNIAA